MRSNQLVGLKLIFFNMHLSHDDFKKILRILYKIIIAYEGFFVLNWSILLRLHIIYKYNKC
jgi:hypothetical protein